MLKMNFITHVMFAVLCLMSSAYGETCHFEQKKNYTNNRDYRIYMSLKSTDTAEECRTKVCMPYPECKAVEAKSYYNGWWCLMFSKQDFISVIEKNRPYYKEEEFVWSKECPKDCPEGWTAKGKQCYKFMGSKRTYEDAKELCTQNGANIIMPKTDKELKGVVEIRDESKTNDAMWIGLNDQLGEGYFMWEDGTPFDKAKDFSAFYAEPQSWQIEVHTSDKKSWAGTDSKVYIEIIGVNATTGLLRLDNKKHNDLEKGQTDTFVVNNVKDIGIVISIKVHLIGKDDWYGESIILKRLNNLQLYKTEYRFKGDFIVESKSVVNVRPEPDITGWKVKTVTDNRYPWSGTNDDVYIQIIGSKGTSRKLKLDNIGSDELERGQTDIFFFDDVKVIGDVEILKIELVDRDYHYDADDGWYIKSIELSNLNTLQVYRFGGKLLHDENIFEPGPNPVVELTPIVEPNNNNTGDNCAEIRHDNKWKGIPCTVRRHVICQK